MTRWFASLPIHRKLVVMVLAVSTIAVAAAVVGLLGFDIARFHSTAIDDTRAFAEGVAATSAAAVVFDDPQEARQILESAQLRVVIARACVYRTDGTLLAAYQRSTDVRCPSAPSESRGWRAVAVVVPVSRGGRVVGTLYVERLLSDLPGRILVTALAAFGMLLVAAGLAFGLAQRIQHAISRPIVALATAARSIGAGRYEIPAIDTPPDETRALVRAFSEMIGRLSASSAEREALLVREREASRLKDEFLAAVSHELRTPLNAIVGWAQVLKHTRPSERTIATAIESIFRNARAQNRVIEDLLDVSGMISGKLQLTVSAMDLRVALESAVEVIASVASAKRVQIDVRAPLEPFMIQGDFDRIRQVLWNLLSNAVKFTPAGGRVEATLANTTDGFRVTVKDTGIGIDATFLPYVFDRFRQADGSTTREHGGLGLGLAIVKELTERHSGTIIATSDGRGRGATFVLTLPPLIGSVGRDGARESGSGLTFSRVDGVTVLAIDDNSDALEVLSSTLTAAGAHVQTFSSPSEALAAIERARPDVLLCDLAMPALDGFEVLRRIRESDRSGGYVPLPVIAVTAYASDEYRDRCRRAGFQAHIAKPYDAAELIRNVQSVLVRA